jgi:hypothetical protein
MFCIIKLMELTNETDCKVLLIDLMWNFTVRNSGIEWHAYFTLRLGFWRYDDHFTAEAPCLYLCGEYFPCVTYSAHMYGKSWQFTYLELELRGFHGQVINLIWFLTNMTRIQTGEGAQGNNSQLTK